MWHSWYDRRDAVSRRRILKDAGMAKEIETPDNMEMDFLDAYRCQKVVLPGPLAVFSRLSASLRSVGALESARKMGRKLRSTLWLWFGTSSVRLTRSERQAQRETVFVRSPLVSILVPAYNTPPHYLRTLIKSVRMQTYENWELCFADGSDTDHPQTGEEIHAWAKKDARIRYKRLEKNLGIAENTNACADMARGEYMALLDHDDALHASALYHVVRAVNEDRADFIYTDEAKFRKDARFPYMPHFKPDFAPDTLRSNNYICHFTVFARELFTRVGRYRSAYDGSQDHDMVLRLTEQAQRIVHIPKILYFWRAHKGSVSGAIDSKPYAVAAGVRAVEGQLDRLGLRGVVTEMYANPLYRIQYIVEGTPSVSILMYGERSAASVERSLRSVLNKTSFLNYEIILAYDGEKGSPLLEREQFEDPRLQLVPIKDARNRFELLNCAAEHATGEHVTLLDAYCEVLTPSWIEEMLMYSCRSDVGAVGATLYYPDYSVRHAGLAYGLMGAVGRLHHHFPLENARYMPRPHHHFPLDNAGYMSRLAYVQNLSAVSGECMMLKRSALLQAGGLDENYTEAFADVDLCLRLRQTGCLVVFTPFAELLFHRAEEEEGMAETDRALFLDRWADRISAGDPYYNPNLTLVKENLTPRYRRRSVLRG